MTTWGNRLAKRAIDGGEALETAAYANVLAGALLEDGRYGEAEPLARRVLAAVEKAMGAQNARTAAAATRLAETIVSQGRYEEGEALFRRAVTINETALGAENPEIDPEGYGLIGPNGAPIAGAVAGSFDRQAAYELYLALLGDASIQAAIKSKSQLLFVPSGALLSLPPGLLVTAAPPGGRAKDSDRESLRATSWLLRSKAVSMLPAVASLRTLRQILPGGRAMTSDPLLAFADPDFRRPSAPAKTRGAKAAARGFASYFRDGLPLAEALDGLPNLPGTRIEGEALEKALQGRPGSLLTGREASKAQLMARNADGRLAQVRVLEFATHGLVAGDASDLAEPALALAAGANPADELLLASEAATLKLNAEWVLLSACNTASPDAPQAQGLSGLSRAFFYAGARSLLVSHWRVRDDVAPRLIPAMLLAEREHPELGRAQALRQASLAVLDDRTINAADPAA
ncbi:MAG: CHAT domain-containing protein, partial [Steroidobacteraceae bacterium]